jgi:hypothetical protein
LQVGDHVTLKTSIFKEKAMLLLTQLAVLVGIFAGACICVCVMSATGFLVKVAAIQLHHYIEKTRTVRNVLNHRA